MPAAVRVPFTESIIDRITGSGTTKHAQTTTHLQENLQDLRELQSTFQTHHSKLTLPSSRKLSLKETESAKKMSLAPLQKAIGADSSSYLVSSSMLGSRQDEKLSTPSSRQDSYMMRCLIWDSCRRVDGNSRQPLSSLAFLERRRVGQGTQLESSLRLTTFFFTGMKIFWAFFVASFTT